MYADDATGRDMIDITNESQESNAFSWETLYMNITNFFKNSKKQVVTINYQIIVCKC